MNLPAWQYSAAILLGIGGAYWILRCAFQLIRIARIRQATWSQLAESVPAVAMAAVDRPVDRSTAFAVALIDLWAAGTLQIWRTANAVKLQLDTEPAPWLYGGMLDALLAGESMSLRRRNRTTIRTARGRLHSSLHKKVLSRPLLRRVISRKAREFQALLEAGQLPDSLNADQWRRLFPHAVALGMEDAWARHQTELGGPVEYCLRHARIVREQLQQLEGDAYAPDRTAERSDSSGLDNPAAEPVELS